MTTPHKILIADKMKKQFSYPAKRLLFKDLSLSVCPGESVAITGPSGAGKSTLLNILGTLEEATEGTLIIKDQVVTSFNRSALRNRHIGFIFQSFHLLDDYTVYENVAMPARIARQNPSPTHIKHLLSLVGMEDKAQHETKLLSGGEKQRVAIARALCNDPSILLADEPTGNLDKANAQMIQSILNHLTKNQKKAVIIVTHDPILAASCSRNIVIGAV